MSFMFTPLTSYGWKSWTSLGQGSIAPTYKKRGNTQLARQWLLTFNIFSQRPIAKQGTVNANCNCFARSPSTAVVHPTSGHTTQMFNSTGWEIGATRVSRGRIPVKLYVPAYLHVDGLGEEDVGRHEQAGVCTCSVAPLKSDDNWLICVE